MRRDISIITERHHLSPEHLKLEASSEMQTIKPEPSTIKWDQVVKITVAVIEPSKSQRAAWRRILKNARDYRRDMANAKVAAQPIRNDHSRFGEAHFELEFFDPRYGWTGCFNCFSTRPDAVKMLARAYAASHTNPEQFGDIKSLPVRIRYFPAYKNDEA